MNRSKRIFWGGLLLVVAALGTARLNRLAKANSASAAAMSVASPTNRPAPLRISDLEGVTHLLQDDRSIRATAIVFLSTQCPISNKYVPELNRLSHDAPAGAKLYGVISDPTVTRAAAMAYVKEYKIAFPVLFDASGELAHQLHPAMTPEAFVLDGTGAIQYRGRIDDGWADLKKQRASVRQHDLQDAMIAVTAGREVTAAKSEPIGCYFEAWKDNALPAKVTYTRDVAPILNANCVSCHRAGEVAPFSLMSYGDAAKHAKLLAKVTDRRLMPPWKAEPGYGHFTDERRLTETEIALLGAWELYVELAGVESWLQASYGKGKVFLLGPEVAMRGQAYGTFKFVFNGLMSGPAVGGKH